MLDRRARFDALAHEVGQALHRYAARRVGPDLADDVVADALLVLWRRLDDVPEVEPLPWCYGVARLCVRNVERSERRHRRLVARIKSHTPAMPLTSALVTERDAALHEALARLPEGDREILRLWAWESLTASEIAVSLGISANAASIRLHRARQRLAEELHAASRKIPDSSGHSKVQERRTP